jgi:hypothetical protein
VQLYRPEGSPYDGENGELQDSTYFINVLLSIVRASVYLVLARLLQISKSVFNKLTTSQSEIIRVMQGTVVFACRIP